MSFLGAGKRFVDELFFLKARLFLPLNKRGNGTLIVRTDGIGDLLNSFPYIEAIKKAHPAEPIYCVCRRESAPWAEASGLFDKVIGFEHSKAKFSYWKKLWLILTLRELNVARAFYLAYHREQLGDELTILSGARFTACMKTNEQVLHPRAHRRHNKLFTHVVDVPDHVNEHEKYMRLLEALRVPDREMSPISSFLPLAKSAPANKNNYVLIAPFTSDPLRDWPIENYIEVAERIEIEFGMKAIFCAMRKETKHLEKRTSARLSNFEVHYDLTPSQLTLLARNASCVVANDSAIAHLGVALGQPTVVALGGGHYNRYFPHTAAQIADYPLTCYGCNWKCRYSTRHCISGIRLETLFERVREAISHPPQSRVPVRYAEEISIVIPTYNRPALAKKLIEQLTRHTILPREVIIVEQGDEHVSAPEKNVLPFELHIAHHEPPNRSAAKNVGLRLARGRIILFLDDDIQIPNNLVEVHWLMHKEPNVGGVTCRTVEEGQKDRRGPVGKISAWGIIHGNHDRQKETKVESPNGSNMSFKRAALPENHRFDERLWGTSLMEEPDFCAPLISKGWGILFTNKTTVVHEPQKNGNLDLRQTHTDQYYRDFHHNLTLYFLKHRNPIEFFTMVAGSTLRIAAKKITYGYTFQDARYIFGGILEAISTAQKEA